MTTLLLKIYSIWIFPNDSKHECKMDPFLKSIQQVDSCYELWATLIKGGDSENTLDLDEDRRIKTSLHVNWNILKPIMALCNEKCTLKFKNHKSPSKDLRATWCKNGQMSHRGRLEIVSYLDAINFCTNNPWDGTYSVNISD